MEGRRRGSTIPRDTIFTKGTDVCWYQFSSCSRNLQGVMTFAGQTGPATLFEVDVCAGYDISKLSVFGELEAEILLPPLTQFEVTARPSKSCVPDGWTAGQPYPPNYARSLGPDRVQLEQQPDMKLVRQLLQAKDRAHAEAVRGLREEMARMGADRGGERIAALEAVLAQERTAKEEAVRAKNVAVREKQVAVERAAAVERAETRERTAKEAAERERRLASASSQAAVREKEAAQRERDDALGRVAALELQLTDLREATATRRTAATRVPQSTHTYSGWWNQRDSTAPVRGAVATSPPAAATTRPVAENADSTYVAGYWDQRRATGDLATG